MCYFSSLWFRRSALNENNKRQLKFRCYSGIINVYNCYCGAIRQCCQHLQEKQNMICGCMACDPITCHSKHMSGNLGLANHMGWKELALENNMVHRLKLIWHLMCEYAKCLELTCASVTAYVWKQESWNLTRHSLAAAWHFLLRC